MDDGHRDSLIKNGLINVKKYHPRNIAKKYYRFYQKNFKISI
jgi:hypothetical protein